MTKKVIFSSPDWHLNGVNVFTANLAKQLIKKDYDVEILLTQTDRKGIYKDKKFDIENDLPIKELEINIKDKHFWISHWEAIKKYLEDNSPCIYIPNYDFYHAAVCPTLSEDILILGVVHSDDEVHYEQTKRLGRFWNAIITVSENIHKKVIKFDQYNNDKIFRIDYGIKLAKTKPIKNIDPQSPIKLVYSGRLNQHQKRILDIPKIMNELHEKKINFEFNIIGDGGDGKIFRKKCSTFIRKGLCKIHGLLPNNEVFRILKNSDLFILTSNFEGKPLSLLEAMGQGCVPIVTDINSGIPELIENGVNGFKIPVGNISQFVETIENLYINRAQIEKLSAQAFEKVSNDKYKLETMTKNYIEVFDFMIKRRSNEEFKRPIGDIYPPRLILFKPDILNTVSWKITAPLRKFGDFISQFGIKI